LQIVELVNAANGNRLALLLIGECIEKAAFGEVTVEQALEKLYQIDNETPTLSSNPIDQTVVSLMEKLYTLDVLNPSTVRDFVCDLNKTLSLEEMTSCFAHIMKAQDAACTDLSHAYLHPKRVLEMALPLFQRYVECHLCSHG